MTVRRWTIVERIYTRDAVEHVGDGHQRHVPQPPDNDLRWRIFDLEPTRKTRSERTHEIEGCA